MSTIRTFDAVTKQEAVAVATAQQLNQGPPTREQMLRKIGLERKRRLDLGFDYDFGFTDPPDNTIPDPRGVHRIGTTDEDMTGWREVIDLANALIDSGAGATQINIVTDTGPTAVTAFEWQSIMLAAGQARQVIWASSFALQAMDPIPDDYDADSYWTP